MGKHAPAGRKFDESLAALRKALMVAGKATPSGNPGDATFDHPSSGKDLEACRGRCGLWLGFGCAGIGGCPQTLHGLNVPSELLFSPFSQFPPVMTVSPNEGKPGKASSQSLKELLASRQVRITGRCHLDFHQVADGVSTSRFLLRPQILLLMSKPFSGPRTALVLMDWLSITAALGS